MSTSPLNLCHCPLYALFPQPIGVLVVLCFRTLLLYLTVAAKWGDFNTLHSSTLLSILPKVFASDPLQIRVHRQSDRGLSSLLRRLKEGPRDGHPEEPNENVNVLGDAGMNWSGIHRVGGDSCPG